MNEGFRSFKVSKNSDETNQRLKSADIYFHKFQISKFTSNPLNMRMNNAFQIIIPQKNNHHFQKNILIFVWVQK